jgi:hypothetical protein
VDLARSDNSIEARRGRTDDPNEISPKRPIKNTLEEVEHVLRASKERLSKDGIRFEIVR